MSSVVEDVEILRPITIQLKFKGGGWARMTFTEAPQDRWHVQISSDWGSWDHWWDRSGTRSSIFDFINVKESYFYAKFTAGERELADEEKTKTALRKAVREHFMNDYWGNREEWDAAMNDINYYISDFSCCETFMNRFERMDNFPEELKEEAWHYYRTSPHPRSRFFFKKIFPKFGKHIKKLGREYETKKSS